LKVISKPPKQKKEKAQDASGAEREFLRVLRTIPEDVRRSAENEVRRMRDAGEA
jgi:hypothetical protein